MKNRFKNINVQLTVTWFIMTVFVIGWIYFGIKGIICTYNLN